MSMDELELDLIEVERLLGQTGRPCVRGRLLLLLKELQEVREALFILQDISQPRRVLARSPGRAL